MFKRFAFAILETLVVSLVLLPIAVGLWTVYDFSLAETTSPLSWVILFALLFGLLFLLVYYLYKLPDIIMQVAYMFYGVSEDDDITVIKNPSETTTSVPAPDNLVCHHVYRALAKPSNTFSVGFITCPPDDYDLDSIGVCTGVTDVHDELIFEDDIVRIQKNGSTICEGMVYYSNGAFVVAPPKTKSFDKCTSLREAALEGCSFLVVGNAYDVPFSAEAEKA